MVHTSQNRKPALETKIVALQLVFQNTKAVAGYAIKWIIAGEWINQRKNLDA